MIPLIVAGLGVILLWSSAARRLRRWHVSGPLVLVVGGIVAALVLGDGFASHLDTELAERVVELILAILLFVDATEVRDGFLAGERALVARLLLIALPLSLSACLVLGLGMFHPSSWAVVLAIACVVMPIDFAPAAHLLKDRHLPLRVRHVLAVESGYNDGFFSPVFLYAVLLLGGSEHGGTPASALRQAVPAAGWAVLIGVGLGAVAGAVLRRAARERWTDHAAIGVAVAVLPLFTYALAVGVGGNGFVAAFLAGIAYRRARTGRIGRTGRGHREADIPHEELAAVESLGSITSMLMWFVFGAVAELVFGTGAHGSWILFGLLVLTVVRMVPVYLSMLGSPVGLRDRTLLGLVGPRGTSSIVFALLTYNAAREDDADLALGVAAVVILGSLLLHGFLLPLVLRRQAVRAEAARTAGQEAVRKG